MLHSRFVARPFVVLMLATLAATLTFARPAGAQGMYYKEIAKDGRIYVFNNAANAERFEKSGEMGVGITMLGAGKNGETVTGDNERALQLYFFKNGLSTPVLEPPAPVQTVVWRDGKTRFTLGDNFYLEMSSRVQVRFTTEDPSDNLTPTGGTMGDSRSSFRIRRAKFKLEGWMIRSWISFETQVNWPALISNNANNSNAGALLEDAAFDVDLTKGRGLFRVHAGQFKVPYGAQELTSSGSQQFVDRALVSNTFFRGRDAGVALWGVTPNNKFEWRFGAFNGNGVTRTFNDNRNRMQYNGRLMWQPNGSQVLNQRSWVTGALYSESDFESTTAPIYALGVNFEHQNNFGATAGNDQKWNAVSIDGIYKYKGFSVNGMYTMAMRTPETGAEFDADGFFIQAGYLFRRRTLELAIRHGQSDPSNLVEPDTTKESRVAFNWYYIRHGLKWQSDIGQVEVRTSPTNTTRLWEFRSQLQFIF